MKLECRLLDDGPSADSFLRLSEQAGRGDRWFLSGWLASWVEGRQEGSSSQRWPSGLTSQPFPALPTLPCALCSPTPARQGQGVWSRPGSPSCFLPHWILQPEVPASTSSLTGLSRALIPPRKGLVKEDLAFSWKPGGWGFPGHVCTPIHSANIQGHLLGLGAIRGKYTVNAQKCQVYSSRHHEGVEGKERLDLNLKEEDQVSRR